ncbi:ribonuclease D [Chondromyces crocatus]|uniref:HRDC domain-containing protein n=1 Tax=Chondromyces crocatus TaxID=52 RepID=A0A0K1EJI8_CHOCO|nr:ribonuclease D [Chondromyces crocatus]AKT41025.1 uncharacterized protein CMC5_051830 [Chondromyces crocatus]
MSGATNGGIPLEISPLLVEDEGGVRTVVERAMRAPRVAVDVEANGLFAYRCQLCTVQLAFEEDGGIVTAIVDALRVPLAALGTLLGPEGPVKVLHDLAFDARMLCEAGVPLSRARDTSVAALFLGAKATGLASLLSSELGIHIDKQLQHHDWGLRPLGPTQIRYLAGDVIHLLALDTCLLKRAETLGIADELAEECGYRLEAAQRPPRDSRPSYARVKGVEALDPVGRAILRRALMVREAAAESEDVPNFKVVGSEALLALAQRRPSSLETLGGVPALLTGRAALWSSDWLRAVAEGIADGDVPEEDRALFARHESDAEAMARFRAQATQRRALTTRIGAWRREEARRRGVDEQVVLPGHCVQDLATLAVQGVPGEEAVCQVRGLGARRLERYGATLVSLLAEGRTR